MESSLEYIDCIICSTSEYIISLDYLKDTLVKCKKCGLVFRRPRKSPEEMHKFYETEYYSIRGDEVVRKEKKRKVFNQFLDRIPLYTTEGRILDVGCGFGQFLKQAKERGWKVFGVDLSIEACEYINRELRINVLNTDIINARFPDKYFDAVTFWNVLEDLPYPSNELKEVRRVLKDEGTLFIRMPNFSFQKAMFLIEDNLLIPIFDRNKGIFPRISVFYTFCFTKNSISRLLRETEFNPFRIMCSTFTQNDMYSQFHNISERFINYIKSGVFRLSELIRLMSLNTFLVNPNIEIYAKKSKK